MGDYLGDKARVELERTRDARSLALDRALQHFRGYNFAEESRVVIEFADDLFYYIQDGTLPDVEED